MEILFVSVEGTKTSSSKLCTDILLCIYLVKLEKNENGFFLVPREYRILSELVELVQICGADSTKS